MIQVVEATDAGRLITYVEIDLVQLQLVENSRPFVVIPTKFSNADTIGNEF